MGVFLTPKSDSKKSWINLGKGELPFFDQNWFLAWAWWMVMGVDNGLCLAHNWLVQAISNDENFVSLETKWGGGGEGLSFFFNFGVLAFAAAIPFVAFLYWTL